jgi:hypothetical protein
MAERLAPARSNLRTGGVASDRVEGRDQDERVLPLGWIEGAVDGIGSPTTRDRHFAVDQ